MYFVGHLTLRLSRMKRSQSGVHGKYGRRAHNFGYDFGPIILLATFFLRRPINAMWQKKGLNSPAAAQAWP